MDISLPDRDVFLFIKAAKQDFETNAENCQFMHIPKNIVRCFSEEEHFCKFLIAAMMLSWQELVTEIRNAYKNDEELKDCIRALADNTDALKQLLSNN